MSEDVNRTVLDGFSIFGATAANVLGANSYAIYLWSWKWSRDTLEPHLSEASEWRRRSERQARV